MPHVDKNPLSIYLHNMCNLNCRYCYSKKECLNDKEMIIDFEFVKKAFNEYYNNGGRSVRFVAAGEPTLKINYLKEIYAYINHHKKQISYEIQTNGVFPKEVAEWLAKNIEIIWISFDGIPEAHDQLRPLKNGKKSSDIIINNLKTILKLKKNNQNDFAGVRLTVTKLNVLKIKEAVLLLHELGVRYIYTDMIFQPVLSDNDINDLYISEKEYIDSYLEAYEFARGRGIFLGSFYIINFDSKSIYHCRSCIPTPHLTYDGYVSCCDMATSRSVPHYMQVLLYGKWNNEQKLISYDFEKIKKIQSRNVHNLKSCTECKVKFYCGGGCLGEALNETHDIYGIKKSSCKIVMEMFNRSKSTYSIPVSHP